MNIYNSAVNIYVRTYFFLNVVNVTVTAWYALCELESACACVLCSSQLLDGNYFTLDKVPSTVFHSNAARKSDFCFAIYI